MYYVDQRLAELIVNMRPGMAQSLAQFCDPSQYASTKQRSWLSWQGCRLLNQVGQSLVSLGERLQRFGIPQPSC
jgi:hypothetical protein